MTEIGKTYGEALYSLCVEEACAGQILAQLEAVAGIFRENPAYVQLLSSPAVEKQERCGLLDQAFRDLSLIHI